MAEHVHDWWPMPIKYGGDAEFYGAECLIEGCDALLMETEVAKRINATERLSAEDARAYSPCIRRDCIAPPCECADALLSYANILEGK